MGGWQWVRAVQGTTGPDPGGADAQAGPAELSQAVFSPNPLCLVGRNLTSLGK